MKLLHEQQQQAPKLAALLKLAASLLRADASWCRIEMHLQRAEEDDVDEGVDVIDDSDDVVSVDEALEPHDERNDALPIEPSSALFAPLCATPDELHTLTAGDAQLDDRAE